MEVFHPLPQLFQLVPLLNHLHPLELLQHLDLLLFLPIILHLPALILDQAHPPLRHLILTVYHQVLKPIHLHQSPPPLLFDLQL